MVFSLDTVLAASMQTEFQALTASRAIKPSGRRHQDVMDKARLGQKGQDGAG
jgi:hypothetical protein